MSSQNKSSKMMREGARLVATELIREPVKQAVREAIRDESISVKTSGETDRSHRAEQSHGESGQGSSKADQQQSGGGRSRLAMAGVVLAIAGVAYLARRRMSSTSGEVWSGESSPGAVAGDDAEGGYVSEGEMQTAETADESGSEGTSTSTSTASEQ